MSLPFYLLNVFAEDKYTGNQLTVVICEKEVQGADMQGIARELGFGETAFVHKKKEGDAAHPVSVFTSAGEVPYAGHSALGTAYVIRRFVEPDQEGPVELALKAGNILVSSGAAGNLWMKQLQPQFGEILPTEVGSDLLRLSPSVFEPSLPIQEVSTGLPFLIVPLRHLDAVRQASVDHIQYNHLVSELTSKAILVFSPETYHAGNDFNSRVFSDYFGVPEDSASGAACGSLAGYFMRHGLEGVRDAMSFRVEQGYELKRPSLLHVKAQQQAEDQVDIEVGGKVALLAQGSWEE